MAKRYIKHGDRIIGVEDDTLMTYEKRVNRKKHLMRKNQSYGIQRKEVEKLANRGFKKIIIRETDTKDVYVSQMEQWVNSGIIEEHPPHGQQIFLEVDEMKKK